MGSFKKAKQHSTTPFGAFCAKKLEKANIGMFFFLISIPLLQPSYNILPLDKEKGYRMTLQEFLESYQNDESLRKEYRDCDKPTLVKEHQTKKVKECVPTRIPNISISREVYLRLERITASVRSYGFL